MRVVLDALGSPSKSGGMRLHATQVAATWAERFPSDSVHLVGPKWASAEDRFSAIHIHRWPNESVFTRAPGQLIYTAAVARQVNADFVVSLSPVVTPLSGRPTIAFQHDWRHLKNPSEFGLAQRLYRTLWKLSSRWADVNACISMKTIEETLAVSPGARTALVQNGFDDALSWSATPASRVQGRIVTFGHHNNKRPELVIRALPTIREYMDAELVVLGASGRYRDDLQSLAHELGVDAAASFPGFVDQREYEAIVASAHLVALVSSDEGFGLPIAEAVSLGIPALITTDSGMRDVFGEYPSIAEPTPEDVARVAVSALASRDGTGPADMHTWADAVSDLRELAIALVKRGSRTVPSGADGEK